MIHLKRLVLTVTACSVLVGTSGASPSEYALQKGLMDVSTISEIIEMLEEDEPNDRLSCYWDGEKLSVVPDELDDETVMDGRGGEYHYRYLKTNIGITICSVDEEGLLSEEHIIANDGACFATSGDNRFLRIIVTDTSFDEMAASHDRLISEKAALNYECRWNPGITGESTIMEAPNGKEMIGLRFIQKRQDGNATVYEYGGIGNYSDIVAEARIMARKTIGK